MGLSSDTKPAIAEFMAQFYEYDTGKTYVFTGQTLATQSSTPSAGQWVEYLPLYPVAQDFMSPPT
jgi:hypothetical protein